ncbi:MAG: hypothetical protein RR162_05935 [Oscillospiraceae bacterium]
MAIVTEERDYRKLSTEQEVSHTFENILFHERMRTRERDLTFKNIWNKTITEVDFLIKDYPLMVQSCICTFYFSKTRAVPLVEEVKLSRLRALYRKAEKQEALEKAKNLDPENKDKDKTDPDKKNDKDKNNGKDKDHDKDKNDPCL